jgi:hypothetical protein
MRKLVFDIETNAIKFKEWNVGNLSSLKTIHCLVFKDLGSGEVHRYTDSGLSDGFKELMDASRIIGHNVKGFDIPAIRHLFDWFDPSGEVFDTKDGAKSIFPSYKSHSLKPWGERLTAMGKVRVLKGDFGASTDWSKLTPEMLSYCEQDVMVTSALYDYLVAYAVSIAFGVNVSEK